MKEMESLRLLTDEGLATALQEAMNELRNVRTLEKKNDPNTMRRWNLRRRIARIKTLQREREVGKY